MAKVLTMYEEFQFRGFWWTSDNVNNRIAGILTYNLDGIYLELFGDFSEELRSLRSKNNTYKFILGTTECGKEITLHDGFQVKFKVAGYATTKLRFNQMLIGKHFTSTEEMVFHSVSINYSYLEEWMAYDPFEDQIEEDNGVLKKIGTSYTFPPLFETNIESIQTKVKAGYNVRTDSELYKSKTFKHKGYLEILPYEKQKLEWFLNHIKELQNFLTLLTNRAVYPKEIKFRGEVIDEEDQQREKVQLFLLPSKNFSEDKVSPFDIFIDYHMIKNEFNEVLNNWFKDEKADPSRMIYLENTYNRAADLNLCFLNYAKSMESFHRDTSGDLGQFASNEEYEIIKQAMLDAIPKGINPDLKNKLNSTLKYAHHHGFERRVRDTLKGLEERLKNLTFSDSKKIRGFAGDICTTRDYYTHFGEKPSYYFKDLDLFFANNRMKMILFYHFCTRLEINSETIVSVITKDYNLVHRLKIAQQRLPN
ncbi:ApeA N-terminal domain 1-containing protein [Bacillus cereus]